MPEWVQANPSPFYPPPAMVPVKAGYSTGGWKNTQSLRVFTGLEPTHGHTIGATLGAT